MSDQDFVDQTYTDEAIRGITGDHPVKQLSPSSEQTETHCSRCIDVTEGFGTQIKGEVAVGDTIELSGSDTLTSFWI